MKTSRIWLAILSVVILAVFSLVASPKSVFGQQGEMTPTVEPGLQAQIQRDGSTGYMIYFREYADLSPAYAMDWEARGEYVVSALNETANRSQTDVAKYLDAQNADFQAFWIDNIIIVNSSSQNTFNGLMSFAEIKSLRSRRMMGVIEPAIEAVSQSVLAIEPNISHVLAPDVWGQGITGSGIVVANIDTGVRSTHDALVRQYRGTTTGSHDYNWLGAAGGSGIPVDDHGHGTHTMGTMIGEDASRTNQIGMAPGAQWIACDGCEGAGCPDAALLTCAQWIAAPYPIGDPGSPNAAMRPHAVNNSWGDCGTSYDDWYQSSVDAWQAAGIYPIFSNGNASNCSYSSPPGLNTVGNPARYGNVTGVGSSGESNGQYATHSNWGPTDNLDTVNPKAGWADLKPQVLAPGVSIRSSIPGSDTDYQDGWSGTSMSAPHVTGLVALMWQAGSCLVGDYASTETVIEDTAIPIPYDDGTGGGAHSPNYAAGWGEINALAAIQAAQDLCGGGALTGEVADSVTTFPIPNVLISAENITNTFQTTTGTDGTYSMDIMTGTYDVTASLYGYLPETVSGVTIIDGGTTTQDFVLTQAETYLVSGVVTDTNTGWRLYTSIDIDGYPNDPIWTDPVTGYYEVTLAEGITYTFDVVAWVPGYDLASSEIGPLTGDTMANFALDANLGTCAAPGYDSGGTANFNDSLVPPAGWTVVDNENTGVIWDNLAGCGESGNFTGGSGDAVCASSDIAGTAEFDTELQTPVFDDSQTQLSYRINYQNLANYDYLNVDISTDGGGSWTTMLSWNDDHGGFRNTPGEQVVLDLSPYLAGTDNNIIRWHYYDPNASDWDWYVQIDDVILSECTPPTDGGLVVGNIYDNNTVLPLNGAMVENEDGFTAEAVETPYDEDVDDAFFTIFSPSGTKTFTATLDAYMPNVASVSVTSGDTIGQDFYLDAGWFNVDPPNLQVAVDMGVSTTVPLTLTNQGAADINFELHENDIGFGPNLAVLSETSVYSEPAAVGPSSVRSVEGQTSLVEQVKVPHAWSGGTPLPAGDGVVRYGKAQCDGDVDSFYVIGGIDESLSVTPNVWRYDATTDTWTALADLPNPQEGPTAVCYEGFIYVLNGGGTNGFSIYDITSDSWIAGPTFPRSVWGAAVGAYEGYVYFIGGDSDFNFGGTSNQVKIYDIVSGTWSTGTPMLTAAVTADYVQAGQFVYVVGGWGDSSPGTNVNVTQRYDMSSDTWESGPTFDSGRADGSLAITQQYLYAIGGDADGGGAFDATATIETLDWTAWPGGTWTDISNPLPIAVTANTGGFCTEAVTGGEIWNVGGADISLNVYGNADYRVSEGCFTVDTDIPWLSEDPITGTVPTLSDVLIDVTFDASVPEIDQPGDYLGALKVKNDTPYGTMDVPVTMKVLPPGDWGKLDGVVTGMGYCDTHPAALEEAQVLIESSSGLTLTLMTDASGAYSYWFDETLSPFTVTVSMEEHETVTETNVSVAAGQTTTSDFLLRWLVPCADTLPAALEVDLVIGYTTTLPLTITNMGGLSMTFEIEEIPGGFVAAAGYMSQPSLPVIDPTEVETSSESITIGDLNFGLNPNQTMLVSNQPARTYAPDATTITYSTSQTITGGNSVSCNDGSSHTANSYLRTFTLSDFGVNQAFGVTNVEVGIESASAGSGGSQPGVVNLYTLDGVLEWVNLTLIGSANISVADQDLTILDMPVAGTVPVGATLVVEFLTPDGAADGNLLFVGSNSLGQTAPTYIAAADCAITEPATTDSIGFPDMQLVMNVTGVLINGSDTSPVPWLKETPADGFVDLDGYQDVIVTFEPLLPYVWQLGTYTATLNINNSDDLNDPISVPVTMNVIAPEFGVDLEQNSVKIGKAGETITYELSLTNMSNLPPDTFVIAVGTHNWPTSVESSVIGPLAMDETDTFTVEVAIPAGAAYGASDTVQITAYSNGDVTQYDSVTLVTSTHLMEIFMPLIMR